MSYFFRKMLKLFYNLLPLNIRYRFIPIFGLKNPFRLYKSLHQFNSKINDLGNSYRFLYDWDIWKKALERNIWSDPNNIEIATSFLSCEMEILKKTKIPYSKNDVTLICVVKNDLKRMKMFYNHYRKIGIKHFVIVDNNSDDGTLEWLLEQSDSDIYLARDKFYSKRKYGWINKILSIYGFNRWYLYADSDELFVYYDIENHNIEDLIEFANGKGINRIASLMLDMYSSQPLFSSRKQENIEDEYIFFDTDSYHLSRNHKGMVIKGGPRKRVLKNDDEWEGPLLIKHPLFYLKEGEVFESAHYIFPFEKEQLFAGVLMHYKFIDTDLERYKQIAEEGNFANNSKEYKQYIKSYEKNRDITFMYEGSRKYINSSSLKSIPFLETINWNDKQV